MRDSRVSAPTLSARITTAPVPLIVPPINLAPDSFSTGIDSPVTIDSSIALLPSSTTPSTGTAEEDYWGDPRGSFLAAKNADPVYKLFGEVGLGVDDMPPVETPVGDFTGYHNRTGEHGQNFADRHFKKQ